MSPTRVEVEAQMAEMLRLLDAVNVHPRHRNGYLAPLRDELARVDAEERARDREDWRAQLHSDGTLFLREDCSDAEAARHLVLAALDEGKHLLTRDEAGNLLLACSPGGDAMLLVTPAGEWDRLRPEAWAEGEPDETSRRVWAEVARLLAAVPRELLPLAPTQTRGVSRRKA